jgi:hypothetical protein
MRSDGLYYLSPKTSLMAFAAFGLVTLSGCLTVPQDQGNQVDMTAVPKQTRSANVDFSLESVNWQGTRILFAKEHSENTKSELVKVLREFGIDTTDKLTDLRLETNLLIKDVNCEILYINSNCKSMLFAAAASLYVIPTSIEVEHYATLKIQSGDKPVNIVSRYYLGKCKV